MIGMASAQRMEARRRALIGVVLVVTLGLVSFALGTLRTLERGQSELAASDAAFDRGELPSATWHARRAALLYVPGAPHVAAAYDRLRAIALGSERVRDFVNAVGAWQGMRAAALETAHLWQPHARELDEANIHLDRLLPSRGAAASFAESAPRSLRAPVWTLLLVLGFGAALLGFALTVWRGMRPSGQWSLGRARIPLCVTLLGVLCSVLALLQA
jgi:hypothetical protein